MTKNEFFQYRLSGIISTAAYSSYATLNTFKALNKITALAQKGIDCFDIDSLAIELEEYDDVVTQIVVEDIKRLIERTEALCIAGEFHDFDEDKNSDQNTEIRVSLSNAYGIEYKVNCKSGIRNTININNAEKRYKALQTKIF